MCLCVHSIAFELNDLCIRDLTELIQFDPISVTFTGQGHDSMSAYVVAYVYFVKTADSIEMPFGVVCRVGPRNHVLDGGPDPLREAGQLFFWAAQCNV